MKWFKRKKVVPKPEPRTCEVCGCLVDHRFAIKGVSEVRNQFGGLGTGNTWPFFTYFGGKEYLYTPYYCRVHDPKQIVPGVVKSKRKKRPKRKVRGKK